MYNGVLIGHPLMAQCTQFLSRHKPLTHLQWLDRIRSVPECHLPVDFYNNGATINKLEKKLAALLGKEKALFVHKGMVGQNSALMEYAKRQSNKTIAIHPQSHIELDESMAYNKLMGLNSVFFGQKDRAISSDDVADLPTDLAAICVELPTRRAGFLLPEWQTLETLKAFSDRHNISLHFDGARLFESADYWQKSISQITALCDSVYVSLYKMFGAAAGGIIAGDEAFISSLKPWRTRFGGDLSTAFPYVLSALWGIEHYLPRVTEFNLRAQQLAKLITATLGEKALPNAVHCNGFIVELPVSSQKLEAGALKIAESQHIWLFDRIYNMGDNTSRIEIQVGDALDDWHDDEVVNLLSELVNET